MPPSKIPTEIPPIVYSGDTLYFIVSNSDYPATDGWTMVYSFGTDGPDDIESTASGGDHLFNISSAVTTDWNAGDFPWRAYVKKVSAGVPTIPEQYPVASGNISIRTTAYQSVAKKKIDAIEAYLSGTTGYADYEWTMKSLGDMSVSRGGDPRKNAREDLAYWKSVYAAEQKKEQFANGQQTDNNTVWTRFVKN